MPETRKQEKVEMTIDEYKRRVIELFKSGRATDAQWEEMASLVLYASETDGLATEAIDAVVMGESK